MYKNVLLGRGFLSYLGGKNEGTWTFEAHKFFEEFFCMQLYCKVVCIKREGERKILFRFKM
jgi:hypothetical protein